MTNGDGEKIKDKSALDEITDIIRKVNFCIISIFFILIIFLHNFMLIDFHFYLISLSSN